jgi:hypothetical protein
VIFLSFALNDNFVLKEHLESLHYQKVYVPTFSPAAQIFHLDIYTILMKGQTCEKLGRPHCGFFPAAQIFHSDIFTTLIKVQTCEGGKERRGLFTLRQQIYLH